MRRRRARTALVASAFALLLTVFVVAGCGGGDSDESTAATTEATAEGDATTAGGETGATGEASDATAESVTDFTLGYSTGFLDNPAVAIQLEDTEELANSLGIEMLPPRNAEGDAGQQVADMRTLVDQGAQAIITIVADSEAIIPALEYADSKGVPIVSIDIGPSGGPYYMLVRADNVRMGEEACMEMGERLGGEGKVLNVNGDNAVTNGRNRTNGFNDCMAENFPNIEVINEAAGSWRPEDHTRIVQTTLGTVSDLAGIYLQSDAVALSGALNAIKQAGKLTKVGEEGHITLLAIDGTPESLEAIRDGYLDATVSQPIDLYSQYGVKYAQDAVAGVVYEPGPTDHDSTIVQEAGGLADELPSPVVTSENVDDPDLWGNKAAG